MLVNFRRMMSTAFSGPVQRHIESRILQALAPTVLKVTNESHGRVEDESHFHVLVVSDKFEQVPKLIERHRMVQNLFVDEEANLKFHSLRLTTKTPEQWKRSQQVHDAPKCTGKGDGRGPTDTTNLETSQ